MIKVTYKHKTPRYICTLYATTEASELVWHYSLWCTKANPQKPVLRSPEAGYTDMNSLKQSIVDAGYAIADISFEFISPYSNTLQRGLPPCYI